MKKLSILFLFCFLLLSFTNVKAQFVANNSEKNEKQIQELVLNQLKTQHVNPKKIDDEFSKKMFKTYLDSIDRCKIFLLQSDIDEFKEFEIKLDDQIKENDLTFFFLTYGRLMLRMREGKEIYSNILKNQLDFKVDEDSKYNREQILGKFLNTTIATNKKEQISNWNNYLKSMVANQTQDLYVSENNSTKTLSDYFTNISQNLYNLMESNTTNYENLNKDDIFQHYINSIILQFDPHSKYYTPWVRDKYLMKQTGKLEGSGLTLGFIDNAIQIKKVITGSPAWKSKKFEVGDIILKIAQENEKGVNIIGFTAFEASKLLKGKSKTVVKITTKKPNGTIEEITLKRGLIALNDYFIKSCLVKKNEAIYGVISFDNFYNDFDDDKSKNSADDFAREIEILKRNNANGLIIDLRSNKGEGSLETAIKIIGNFITKNPVVQLKDKDNKLISSQSENINKNWDKSVVLIVNSETASTAEIIVAAFKEYNIGVVIGENTFGKGTIQNFQNLNLIKQAKDIDKDLGALSISYLKFYNLNGKSIQKTGIIPDVVLIDNKNFKREIIISNSLIPDEVKQTLFIKNNEIGFFKTIINKSQIRTKSKNFINRRKEVIDYQNFQNDLKAIKTLNVNKRETQLNNLIENRNKQIEQIVENNSNIEFTLTNESKNEIEDKQYLAAKRNAWLKLMKDDFQIDEGINILEDMLLLKK